MNRKKRNVFKEKKIFGGGGDGEDLGWRWVTGDVRGGGEGGGKNVGERRVMVSKMVKFWSRLVLILKHHVFEVTRTS